jgi:hypothetical protein
MGALMARSQGRSGARLADSVFLEDLFAVGLVDGQRFQGNLFLDLFSVHDLERLANAFRPRCRVKTGSRELYADKLISDFLFPH